MFRIRTLPFSLLAFRYRLVTLSLMRSVIDALSLAENKPRVEQSTDRQFASVWSFMHTCSYKTAVRRKPISGGNNKKQPPNTKSRRLRDRISKTELLDSPASPFLSFDDIAGCVHFELGAFSKRLFSCAEPNLGETAVRARASIRTLQRRAGRACTQAGDIAHQQGAVKLDRKANMRSARIRGTTDCEQSRTASRSSRGRPRRQ